jgi:Ca-activated chloride channel family protein
MLVLLSLARPVQEQSLQLSNIQAKDIIIALDVSYSMRAKDLAPTRYDFAKETIKILLEKNPSDNIMLMAFTTNPLLLSPPTTDHTLINIALQSLNPEFILTKGTSLEKLFTRLSSMQLSHKNLILITDGGEESDINKLVPLLKTTDISLTILALGSKQGTTIENKDGSLLKDKQGNLVISRINPLLENLAYAAEGTYLSASSSSAATANSLDNALRKNHTKTEMIEKMQHHYAERYQFPLLLALMLFLMLHTRAVKYLIILFALFGLQAEASFMDVYHLNQAYKSYDKQDFLNTKQHLKKIQTRSLQSQIALANTYYKEGKYTQAIKVYTSIQSTSVKTKQQLYYNIANAYAKLEAYDKAKTYYTKTLQLGKERDALFNLKLIVLLSDKKDASLGMAHPKSQGSDSSKSETQEDSKEKTREEDQPSSGSGAGGESKSKEKQKQAKLISNGNKEQQPLGSKVYDLINKGYIHETQPW